MNVENLGRRKNHISYFYFLHSKLHIIVVITVAKCYPKSKMKQKKKISVIRVQQIRHLNSTTF